MTAPTLPTTAAELARALSATLQGRGDVLLRRLASLDDAREGDLGFVRSARFAQRWASSNASAALVSVGVDVAVPQGKAVIFVPDADLALALLLSAASPNHADASGPGSRHPSAVVDPAAHVDTSAHLGPGSVVEAGAHVGPHARLGPNAVLRRASTLGAHSQLGPGAVIEHGCIVGQRCRISANVVIGSDGFGYRPTADGLVRIPHAGNVVIGDDVDIGAGTCVDRAKLGSTTIGAGTKIDNLVQIGHNCTIGKHCVICGCVGIAGSVTIGDGAKIGGGAGIADNIAVADGARIAAASGVMDDVPAGQMWVGAPARPAVQQMRQFAAVAFLTEHIAQLRKLLDAEDQHSAGEP